MGQRSGAETEMLSQAEMAAHTHAINASSTAADSNSPAANVLAQSDQIYHQAEAATSVAMRNTSMVSAGGGQAHDNMQPFQVINFCIALQGLFPSRN